MLFSFAIIIYTRWGFIDGYHLEQLVERLNIDWWLITVKERVNDIDSHWWSTSKFADGSWWLLMVPDGCWWFLDSVNSVVNETVNDVWCCLLMATCIGEMQHRTKTNSWSSKWQPNGYLDVTSHVQLWVIGLINSGWTVMVTNKPNMDSDLSITCQCQQQKILGNKPKHPTYSKGNRCLGASSLP